MGPREEQAKGAGMPPARWTRNILVSFTIGTPALVLLRGAALTCVASVGLGNENVLVGSLVQTLLWMEEPALRLWVPPVLPHSPELPVQVSGPRFSCSRPVFLGWPASLGLELTCSRK